MKQGWLASGGMIVFALTGCVSGPRVVAPVNVSALSYANVVIDDQLADGLTAAERTELLRVLGQMGHSGTGRVRAVPSYTFRPASIAVIGEQGSSTNEPSSAKPKSWFGAKRWEARYDLTLIDDAGKQVFHYATHQIVGKSGSAAARKGCFSALMAAMVQASRR